MNVALYVRTSTNKQEDKNQLLELQRYAEGQKWSIVREYGDETSGGPSGEQGQFGLMMADASRRKFDAVLFWAWDRLTRRGPETVFHIMSEFDRMGVAYVSLKEPFLSSQSDPMMRELLGGVVGWVAKYERIRQSDRVKAWHERREAEGKSHTRPKGAKDKKPRTRRWWKKPATLQGSSSDWPRA